VTGILLALSAYQRVVSVNIGDDIPAAVAARIIG